jgi:hypothetical protein
MSTQVTFDHEYRGKELNSKEKEDYERKNLVYDTM